MEKTRADGLPLPQRYGAILTIIIGISMAVLDGAIANVALPTIATDLHASPASSIWIVNAYQIAIVVSLLSLSFLGDMFGYRRIYKCGLVVFLLSSLFCALSDSLQMLTLARIAQGIWRRGANERKHGADSSYLPPASSGDEAWELTLLSSQSLPPRVR
ncbi:transport protein, partial [Salmonella enterica subsp. enterica serovar Enteritidis str. 648903 1-6]